MRSILLEVPQFLARVSAFLQVHIKCTCFRFHFQRLYVFAQEIFLKKSYKSASLAPLFPECIPHHVLIMMICILVHAGTERITEFSVKDQQLELKKITEMMEIKRMTFS